MAGAASGMTENPASGAYIGLMSGTSMDGVDGVVIQAGPGDRVRVLAAAHRSFEPWLRAELLDLNTPGVDELSRAALAGNALARVYASVVQDLLASDASLRRRARAIGVHGQTVRHRPGGADGVGYTIQLNNPALLAELTGVDVVADFRSRDVAAGGQGAPLAPAFHAAALNPSGGPLAVLNLGGIGNLSLLAPDQQPLGFDCGPGNALLDFWCERHLQQPYDDGGRWAAGGSVLPTLLQALMAEPYLALPPPKSTGRDLFNPPWLAAKLAAAGAAAPRDIQATLAAFTVACVVQDLERHAGGRTRHLVVCGGGAYNAFLLQSLGAALPGWQVDSSDRLGVPPLQVEAACFAWLAWRFVQGLPGNLPSVTGAAGPRRLGALYPTR